MINPNYDEMNHLKNNEEGEKFDLKRFHKWVINSMPYDDFCKFAKLRFMNNRVESSYLFEYNYLVEPKNDTPKAREEYLKYLAYKMYQNLATEGIILQ